MLSYEATGELIFAQTTGAMVGEMLREVHFGRTLKICEGMQSAQKNTSENGFFGHGLETCRPIPSIIVFE
ncbi:MAG: hypothetical protein HYX44_10065 [Aquabacterium sp.]|nr:hypothetical protein [Aquabacterium sp.]